MADYARVTQLGRVYAAYGRRLWFAGQCSADFGLLVDGAGSFTGPERDVDTISIPGRSGDLVLDNGRYKNVQISYTVGLPRRAPTQILAIRGWLLSAWGYQRLEDSFHPEHYRQARLRGSVDFEMRNLRRAGEATLTFDCKPQHYRKDGDHPLLLVSPTVVCNPTANAAQPLIRVFGTGVGTVAVGSVTVQVKSLDGELMLDCEAMNACWVADGSAVNLNSTISAPAFPVLAPGENAVSWTGGVTGLEITPRWFDL